MLLFWQHPRALLLVGPGGGIRYDLRRSDGGDGADLHDLDDDDDDDDEEEDEEGEGGGVGVNSSDVINPETGERGGDSAANQQQGGRVRKPLFRFSTATGPISAAPQVMTKSKDTKGRAAFRGTGHRANQGTKGERGALTPVGSSRVVLITERDGCRLVGTHHTDIVARVAQPLVDVFQIGSTAPPALLWEAHQLFREKSAKVRPSH